MDPNETLAELRLALKRYDSAGNAYEHGAIYGAADVVVAIMALDEWLSSGGFLPDDWKR